MQRAWIQSLRGHSLPEPHRLLYRAVEGWLSEDGNAGNVAALLALRARRMNIYLAQDGALPILSKRLSVATHQALRFGLSKDSWVFASDGSDGQLTPYLCLRLRLRFPP